MEVVTEERKFNVCKFKIFFFLGRTEKIDHCSSEIQTGDNLIRFVLYKNWKSSAKTLTGASLGDLVLYFVLYKYQERGTIEDGSERMR